MVALDQVLELLTCGGLWSNSLKLLTGRSRIRSGQESTGFRLSSPSPRACGERAGVRGSLHESRFWREPLTRIAAQSDLSPQTRGEVEKPHCVFATFGGAAVVTNEVASSIAGPNGVGIDRRNGTRIRVPAIGTKAISMLRWEARYFTTGR